MDITTIIITIAIGLLAGFINVFGGGGSLLTLPLLIFMGLPPQIANGTNRIALILQNVVASGSFRQQKVLDMKTGFKLLLPALPGAILGAFVAVNVDDKVFELILGALLVLMFTFVLIKPRTWERAEVHPFLKQRPWIVYLGFFFIGLYGGFIQAGIGFFIIALLVLGKGLDLVRTNALKLFIVLIYNSFAFAVFIIHGVVDYKIGGILAIGNMAGAYIGSRLAVKKGPKLVRYLLLFGLILSAGKLLGFFDFIEV